jgi:hypothetical protein
MPTATAYLWEALDRGTDASWRGVAMGMAFGGGPLLAVIGSFCQTALLGGPFFFWELDGVGYPWGFVILFGAGVPMMGLAMLFGQSLTIPPAEQEPRREPIRQVVGALVGVPMMFLAILCMFLADLPAKRLGAKFDSMMQIHPDIYVHDVYVSTAIDFATLCRWTGYTCGIISALAFVYHFRAVLRQRTLLLATLVTLLVYCGNMIPPNMNLYSSQVMKSTSNSPPADAVGAEATKEEKGVPAEYAGIQNTLRFGFKMFAGIFLGWLLTRTNPRAGILVTSLIFLSSQIWALFATGPAYLVAFGLYGAGELVGAYAPNYLVSASSKKDLRKTTALMTMLMAPAAPIGYLYGSIVDLAQERNWTALGMTSAQFGFRMSFLVCALFIFSGIVLALAKLPKQPRCE